MILNVIFALIAAVYTVANPLPEPDPFGFGHTRKTNIIVHVPQKIHTMHHHHVETVPVLRPVPVFHPVPVIKEVPVIRTVPIVNHVPIFNTVTVEQHHALPAHSWSLLH